ncbi:MAG: BamA/TamA family outer membrane protein [Asticcacaulis sp.]|uniref:autotransporter assembly complex protein TamA n=1 Tax=Asticcacaulis sp. TaxID=1872648 RepID=UPI0039E69A54
MAANVQAQETSQDATQQTAKDTTPVEVPPVKPAQEEAPPLPDNPQDAPIISDDDFNAALPPIEETNAPPAEATPDTAASSVTAPEPATEAGAATASDALPEVTATDDPELDAALPALEGYDVQPTQTAAAEPEQPEIRYATVVDGLRDIHLNDEFKPLSALMNGKGKAANVAQVRARATEDEALILRLLKSQGYYDGTVTTSLTQPSETNGQVQAHIVVVPGPAYHFGLITADSQPTLPPDLIRNALKIQPGEQIVATNVLAAEANVSVVLQQTGYPFVKVGDRDILLDSTKLTGDYTLKVDTGHRSRFGGFKSDGKEAFSAGHVAVLTRFDKGDVYDNRKVDDLREALVSTGLFRSVSVEPVETNTFADDGSEYVDLLVHQLRGPYQTISGEFGYNTGEGVTATTSWQNRNLFPPEGALIITANLGTQEQGLTTTFRRSNAKKRDRTFQLAAGATHNIYDSYEAYTTSVSGSIARSSSTLWQKVWTWSYGFEIAASKEATDGVTDFDDDADNYYIAALPTKLAYDRSDSLLNPATGFRASAEVTPLISMSGGGSSIRTVIDASYYYPVTGNSVLAARTRIGAIYGGELDKIPPSRRLYAGGGGSVRGYSYQQLGPKDSSGDATGGLSLFEASVEYRYRFGNIGIVPFIDIGQSYASTTPSFSDLRVGAGIGARLYTNFGPIRIDVATPINRDKTNSEPQITLYVGIGQAF